MSFEKIAEGTYGKVYLCHETLEIRKSMSKRVVFTPSQKEQDATGDEDPPQSVSKDQPAADPLVPNVEYGAVTELSVYNSLPPSMSGIPQFLHYDEGNDNVELYMTYCGDTIHRWLRNRSYSQIAEVTSIHYVPTHGNMLSSLRARHSTYGFEAHQHVNGSLYTQHHPN